MFDHVTQLPFKVVKNHEDQYSIWPDNEALPAGWIAEGKVGTREECLAYINEVWVDMRPRSLREAMAQSGSARQAS
jgi:MbtH protein